MPFVYNYDIKIDKNGGKLSSPLFLQDRFCCATSRHKMINMSIYHTCNKKYILFSLFWCILELAKIKTNAVRSLSNLCFFSHFCTQMWCNLSSKQYTLFLQDRFWCAKTRHKIINMSFYHDCFKKHINFPVFCCIFGFAKIKQYAIRPPSIFIYFFQIFVSLWMKMHLALTVSTRMQNKRTSAQTDQRLCILS